MKTIFSKIFAIWAVVVLLTTMATTPAFAIWDQLPGQNEFWERFEAQTGISSGNTSSPATIPTPQPTPEVTQPAGSIYIGNSIYNDNRVFYYMPEGGKAPEATPEPTPPQGELSESYEKRSFLGVEFEVNENGHLTSESRLKIFGIFAAICIGVVLLVYIGFFEYLKFEFGRMLEDARDWLLGH